MWIINYDIVDGWLDLLMEQDVFAGIGNIYRAELLYRAGQSPFTAGANVSEETLQKIWKDAGPLMQAGMVDRRIITTLPKDRLHKKGLPLKEEAQWE